MSFIPLKNVRIFWKCNLISLNLLLPVVHFNHINSCALVFNSVYLYLMVSKVYRILSKLIFCSNPRQLCLCVFPLWQTKLHKEAVRTWFWSVGLVWKAIVAWQISDKDVKSLCWCFADQWSCDPLCVCRLVSALWGKHPGAQLWRLQARFLPPARCRPQRSLLTLPLLQLHLQRHLSQRSVMHPDIHKPPFWGRLGLGVSMETFRSAWSAQMFPR